MGYRTVIMLNNDLCSEWSTDPKLGEKIAAAMNHAHREDQRANLDYYGRVVQCEHSSVQSLVMLEGTKTFYTLDSQPTDYDRPFDKDTLAILKSAADKFGYRLVKKSEKKE